MNRQNILVGIVVVGVVALGGAYWLKNRKPAPVPVPAERTASGNAAAKKTGSKKPKAVVDNRKAAVKKNIAEKRAAEARPALPDALQAEADRLQDALDGDNATGIVKSARILLASGNAEARRDAAEALGSAGWDGFAELSALLLDPDKEVAQAARDSWQLQITNMDDEATKKKMFESTAELIVNKDPEYFEEVISDASVEMTDNEALTLLLRLYPQAEGNAESQKVIIEKIDEVVMPESDSQSIEDAEKAVQAWRTENAEDIAEEEKAAAETAGGAGQ